MAASSLPSSRPPDEDDRHAPGDETASDPTHGVPAEEARNAPEKLDASQHARRRLLGAVGRLYALAQTLTRTEHAARRLVEATYARAADALAGSDAPPFGPEDEDVGHEDARAWLFALLVETAREAPGAGDRFEVAAGEAAGEDAEGAEAASAGERHVWWRAQERFLRRALPSAFATLAPAQRLLLTLCDVEGLSAASAARVTGHSEERVREQYARARTDLREALAGLAPRPERAFLGDGALPHARLTAALRGMAGRDFTEPPPALRPAARHALDRPREAPPSTPPGKRAPDRPPASEGTAEAGKNTGARQRLPRLLLALVLIAVAGGAGYLATAVLDDSGPTDLAALSAEKASQVNLRLRTERAEQAEQFVRDELGRRLRVPRIEGAQLRGVGLAEVAGEERVPVFLFRDRASGRPVAAYAYDYALLDRASGRLRLAGDLRRALREEGRVAAQDVGGQRVLLWRHRDDIFAAVTDRADSLRQRIAS